MFHCIVTVSLYCVVMLGFCGTAPESPRISQTDFDSKLILILTLDLDSEPSFGSDLFF